MFRSPWLLLGCCLLLACSQQNPAADATPPTAPADSPTANAESSAGPETGSAAASPRPATPAPDGRIGWPAPFQPAADKQCVRKATQAATVYQRPGAAAPTFGQLAAGEQVILVARTADGWVGFDPATAQAANVGIFRLRWVRAAEAFGADDQRCAGLPQVQAPPSGCLLMAGHPVPVRARPAAAAPVLGLIPAGSYARIRNQNTPPGWTEIEVPGQAAPGYVAAADVELNGPCR